MDVVTFIKYPYLDASVYRATELRDNVEHIVVLIVADFISGK